MKTDTNLCPDCGASTARDARLCANCRVPLVLASKGAIALWRLGEVRPDVLAAGGAGEPSTTTSIHEIGHNCGLNHHRSSTVSALECFMSYGC
jgi:hypothetical protein